MGNNPKLKVMYDVFSKKPNYSFSLIPSSDFFDIIKKAIKENKKDKNAIIKLILSKKQKFPLKWGCNMILKNMDRLTVWDFPGKAGKNGRYPESYRGSFLPDMARMAIEKYSQKGDLIMDPFKVK